MSFESPSSPEKSPKDIYFETIRERVNELKDKGEIPQEYAQGVLERAGYVEGPFDGPEDALEKGHEFLMAIEPIAQFCRQLNDAEKQIFILSEDINFATENLETKTDLAVDKRDLISKDLHEIRTQINQFIEKIKAIRSNIV